MNDAPKIAGLILATAAAAAFSTGCSEYTGGGGEAQASVKCSGINSCKGTSECKTATSACKGQNECKGHGWVNASKEDCESQGGTVL